MPIFSHFPSICPQNFNLRIHDLRICCTNMKPVSKMCAVRLLSPGSTHQKLLAESRDYYKPTNIYSLKMQQVLQRSNNHGCLRVGKSYFSKLWSTTRSAFSFNFITLLNYSACTNSNLSHVFFHTGTTHITIQIKGPTIQKFNWSKKVHH